MYSMTSRSLKQTLGNLISYVLHPALVPLLFAALVIAQTSAPITRSQAMYLMVAIATGTYIFPGLLTVLLYRLGVISSLFMHKREDRKIPYVIGAVFYYFTAVAVRWVSSAKLIYLFLIGTCIVILILLIQIPFYKASAHVAALSGMLAAVLVLSRLYGWSHWYLISVVLTIGLIAWARLEINAHTIVEVIAGFLSGFVPLFALFSLLVQ
ncbi:hypothetical protein DES35_102449 [Schleiferia thermophila]|jgi:hypothetical protein|uniref:PAP2 superfamily protein n=2 Tax=Schleiferia thermophila TaxID=884107 RepID=A0A369A3U0_9FLAO|nr:hypothetical protein DES35_102449 [Schleiferia thermophila]GCD80223.1 hypothetical protein JCM30197_14700 [Schleiferia thermophila]